MARHGARVLKRGMVITDILVCAAIGAVVLALLCVMLPRQRRAAQLFESMGQMKELYTGMQQYGLDHADRVATFSWRLRSGQNTIYLDLRSASSEFAAASNQAIEILRRKYTAGLAFPAEEYWVPHVYANFLVLADYQNVALPWRVMVSPADTKMLRYQSNPLQYQSFGLSAARMCFYSSYELGSAFWSRDTVVATRGGIYQGATNIQYSVNASFDMENDPAAGNRFLTEVVYPAQKTMIYDRFQRHFGAREVFFAYPEGKIPIVAADGALQTRTTGLTNSGFRPTDPTSSDPTQFTYSHFSQLDPVGANVSSSTLFGHYRWTRSGLRGIDFEGAEIPWQ